MRALTLSMMKYSSFSGKFLSDRWEYVFAAALSLILAAFGKDIIESPLYALAAIGMLAIFVILYFDGKLAFIIIISGIILIEEFDLSNTETYFETGISKSIIAMRIFGISFMDALTLLFLAPVLIKEWMHWYERGTWRTFPFDRYFLPIICVYILGAAQGVFNYLSLSDFTWEARDILYILAWYFIASRVISLKSDIIKLVAVILVTFSAKSIIFLYRIIAGQGLFYGFDFYRPALGTDVPLMAVPLITAIAASVLVKDVRRWMNWFLLAMIAYWSIWFISSLGRASYITAALALTVICFMLWKEIRFKHLLIAFGMAVFGGLVYYYIFLTEVNRELVTYLLTSAFNWIDAVKIYSDMSIGQRVLEIINISETLTRAGAWVWGLGWGAPWTEIVVRHPIDPGSFEIMECYRGIHTTAHIDALYFILKVGIVGAAIIYINYALFVIKGIKLFLEERDMLLKLSCISLIAMLLIFIPNYVYFIKLKILMGIVFGSLSFLYLQWKLSHDASDIYQQMNDG